MKMNSGRGEPPRQTVMEFGNSNAKRMRMRIKKTTRTCRLCYFVQKGYPYAVRFANCFMAFLARRMSLFVVKYVIYTIFFVFTLVGLIFLLVLFLLCSHDSQRDSCMRP